jgi:hypothetical protein
MGKKAAAAAAATPGEFIFNVTNGVSEQASEYVTVN